MSAVFIFSCSILETLLTNSSNFVSSELCVSRKSSIALKDFYVNQPAVDCLCFLQVALSCLTKFTSDTSIFSIS